MQIEELPLKSIRPYEKNPRNNDASVDAVTESIREFGFRVPIVIDKAGVIVAGHTRAKADKKLGLKTVPCVRVVDLSEEQVRAFRLADNSVSELSTWDFGLLKGELSGISAIDMGRFNFFLGVESEQGVEIDDESETGEKGSERLRTGDAYNLFAYDQGRSKGFYQFPTIKPEKFMPEDLIGFNYVLSTDRRDAGVHFFIDDYQFERIWNDPYPYIERLREFPCALTPDFSLYMDMPMAMKIWNVYRSRLIGQMMQDAGIVVIPTLSWAEPETFSFCFEGLEQGGVVAVSTVGVMRNKSAQEFWVAGMNEAVRRLRPSGILCYGSRPDYDFGSIPVKFVSARKFG